MYQGCRFNARHLYLQRGCSRNTFSSCCCFCCLHHCSTAGSLQRGPGSASGAAFHRMVLPSDLGALAYSSGRWWGDGVKTRVEGQGEISSAQTITMGSKPQNIYLFRLNGSIKWTPAMFLA